MISIIQLTCDRADCNVEWTGSNYDAAVAYGWGYDVDTTTGGVLTDRDLCPDHAALDYLVGIRS